MTVARHSYADVVRRLVRRLRAEPSPSLPGDRRRLVAAVEQALSARAHRRALVRRGLALTTLGAAAAVALFVAVPHLRSEVTVAVPPGVATSLSAKRPAHELTVLAVKGTEGPGSVIVGGHAPLPLRSGMRLGEGLRLVAPASGEVRVGTAEGTSLALEPRGELTVTEASDTQRFTLHAGAVRARVSRLFAGERFVIDTADAEIEVHGTAFRVAVLTDDAGCGTATRVSVTEGLVSVRAGGREARVSPGESWPAGCYAPEARTTAVVRQVVAHRTAPRAHTEAPRAPQAAVTPPVTAPPATTTEPAPRPAPSELATQNDLFASAVRAKKDGQLAEAVRLLAKLIDEHPRGPLFESATVQRMKILAAIDPAAGARAATDYLARFPSGFARPDAERVAGRAAP